MARKMKEDLRTPDEIRADVPPEHAAARTPELHAYIESEVLRKLKAEHHPINISVDMILSFADNPYQVLDNEEMDELVQSIKERGILTPLIVMPKPNDAHVFELISGHRRLYAAQKAGLETVPAIVCNVSRDEAAIMVVDSNLHREHILPSEKAKAYKLRLDAMKRKAGRPAKDNSSPVATNFPKGRADEEMAEIVGESKDQIRRYIRLNQLESELLSLVDEGKIALRPAVELSYLSASEQENVFETCESEDCTPSLSQAQQMRKLSAQGQLDMDAVFQTMTKPKPNQQEKITLSFQKLPIEKIRNYAKAEPTPQIVQEFLLKAVEHYCRYLDRQKDKGER